MRWEDLDPSAELRLGPEKGYVVIRDLALVPASGFSRALYGEYQGAQVLGLAPGWKEPPGVAEDFYYGNHKAEVREIGEDGESGLILRLDRDLADKVVVESGGA
jgi:hypothetical protein